MPEPEDDEYYWCDLIGLQVVTADGVELGTLADIFETGSNDIYVVRKDRQEYLIPAIAYRDQQRRPGRRHDGHHPAGRSSGSMIFDILTLFPGMFAGPFDESIIKRGKDKQLIDIALHNIRDWATRPAPDRR